MFAVGAVVAGAPVGQAHAQAIAKVQITAQGPSQRLPLGQPFYLEGDADDAVKAVHAVFVRYSFPALGIHDSSAMHSCADVGRVLGKLKPGTFVDPNAAASEGRFDIDALWSRPANAARKIRFDDLNRHHAAFVPPPWIRSGEGGYSLLTPNDSFFQLGARYCLLLYETRREERVDSRSVVAALDRWSQAWEACDAEATAKQGTCQIAANDALKVTLTKAVGGDAAKAETLLVDVRAKLKGPLQSLARSAAPALALARAWNFGALELPTVPQPAASDAIAHALRALLVRNVDPQSPARSLLATPSKGGLSFFTHDGKLEATHLALLPGLDGVRISSDPSSTAADTQATLRTAAADLTLPNSQLSLRDLLEMVRGRLRLGDTHVAISSLPDGVLAALNKRPPALPSESELQALAAVEQRLQQLQDWLTWASVARPGDSPTSSARVAADLLKWLQQTPPKGVAPVQGCASILKSVQKLQLQPAMFGCGASVARGWPGFVRADQSPLRYLALRIAGYRRAVAAWQAAAESTKIHIVETSVHRFARPLDLRLTLGQEAWFFNYVTPIVGMALVPLETGTMAVQTAGVQIYLWPNAVDEPMWTNPPMEELRRMFSLELAAGLKTSSLGPDGRFSGPFDGDMPPLFMGIAAQLLPYTSVSSGIGLFERRASVLAAEEPQLQAYGYVSVALQLNVPDIVQAAAGRSSVTRDDQ